MFIRMKTMKKVSTNQYRLTLDVVDPEREHWDYGDCQLQVDLLDEPSHRAQPRGLLSAAFEIYRLSPNEPPATVEAKLLWDIGQAVDGFIDSLFAAGVLCPFRAGARADTQERME